MSDCTHHWTVTSECPLCLRARVRELEAECSNHAWQENEQCKRAERAEAERDALYRLALTMYSGKHIQDTIDAALKESP